MKRTTFLICLLLGTFTIYGQVSNQKAGSRDEQKKMEALKKKRDEVFNNNDPEFKVNDIPGKWNKESAVVLCQKFYYNYDYTGGGVMSGKYISLKVLVRRRVKLFDKAAVDAFTEFYYAKSDVAAFRVIKPDGSTKDVDPANAVDVVAGTSVPRFYRSLNYYTSYRKIAIPDLEAGDIIDYFYESTDLTLLEKQNQFNYTPVIFTLSGTYPVLRQKYEFIVDRNFFITFKSFNGAPELKQTETTVIAEDKVSKMAKAYVLEDADREKTGEERWSYEFLSDPMVKFQVYYVRNPENCYDFIGKSTEVRSEVARGPEVQDLVMRYLKAYASPTTETMKIKDEMVQEGSRTGTPEEKAIKLYYLWRNIYDYAEYNSNTRSYEESDGPSPWKFIATMTQIMKDLKMLDKVEIVAVVPRNLGSIKSLVLASELDFGFRIGGEGGILLFPFTLHSTHDYIDPLNMGMEAYCFPADMKKKDIPFSTITIPNSTIESNTLVADISVKFSEDMELLQVKKASHYKGLLRYSYFTIALMANNYSSDDGGNVNSSYTTYPPTFTQRQVDEYSRKKIERMEQMEKKQKEALIKFLENDYEVESYDNYRLIKKGRSKDDTVLVFEEQYKVKGMVNKAGRNYSLDVGRLIGSQIKISEDELIRKHDIYYNYPRMLVNNISVELPQGYYPVNINDLEVNVDNEAGTFNSVAVFENGTLTITTTKIYKTNFTSKDKWSLWVSFLESAYNYSQKKLILKKS